MADSTSIREAVERIGAAYPRLASAVRFVEYSQLLSLGTLPAGTFVFTDTMSFDEPRRELAVLVERKMMDHHSRFRVLNSPLRGASAREVLYGSFAGTPITKARPGSIRPPLVLRDVQSTGEGGCYDEVNQLAFHLAERVLDGDPVDQLALTEQTSSDSVSMVFSDTCLNLSDTAPPSPEFINRFGLDVFAVRFGRDGGAERPLGVSDHLRDILPSSSSPGRLSEAVTSAILQLDTIPASQSIPVKVDWEAMARALRLKNPS